MGARVVASKAARTASKARCSLPGERRREELCALLADRVAAHVKDLLLLDDGLVDLHLPSAASLLAFSRVKRKEQHPRGLPVLVLRITT